MLGDFEDWLGSGDEEAGSDNQESGSEEDSGSSYILLYTRKPGVALRATPAFFANLAACGRLNSGPLGLRLRSNRNPNKPDANPLKSTLHARNF